MSRSTREYDGKQYTLNRQFKLKSEAKYFAEVFRRNGPWLARVDKIGDSWGVWVRRK